MKKMNKYVLLHVCVLLCVLWRDTGDWGCGSALQPGPSHKLLLCLNFLQLNSALLPLLPTVQLTRAKQLKKKEELHQQASKSAWNHPWIIRLSSNQRYLRPAQTRELQVLTAVHRPVGTITDFSTAFLQDEPQDAHIWSVVIRAGESHFLSLLVAWCLSLHNADISTQLWL